VGKHLVDLDEAALRRARAELGTQTIKDTVNESLRRTGGDRDTEISDALDVLARLDHADRDEMWRRD
jgi:hypothetical protein